MIQPNSQPTSLLNVNSSTNNFELRLNELSERAAQARLTNKSFFQSLRLFHWVGYGLLVLFLFDLAAITYPPQFMNPTWEFQFIGQMVERAPVPLLGFVLVFVGEKILRPTWERPFVRFLSWLTLIVSLAFFLMVPLGIVNTVRLVRSNQTQIQTQVDEATEQIEATNEQLNQVTTPAEMEVLLRSLDQNANVAIPDTQAMEAVREEVSASLENTAQRLQIEAQESVRGRRNQLVRSAVKWNLGALVIAALFLTLWKGTRWARVRWQ